MARQTFILEDAELDTVQAAVDGAGYGDTIILPAGAVTWTSALTVNLPTTIIGAGIGQTVITNTQNGGVDSGESLTVLASISVPGRVIIRGVEVNGSKTAQGFQSAGSALGAEFWWDQCKFSNMRGRASRNMHWNGSMLISSCAFVDCFKCFDNYSLSGRNESWQSPINLGSLQQMVVEDCTVEYVTWYPASAGASSSTGQGARSAIRYNSFENGIGGLDILPFIDFHGNNGAEILVDNTGDNRSSRNIEIYRNTFYSNAGSGSTYYAVHARGGVGLIYENKCGGSDFSAVVRLEEEDDPALRTSFPGMDMHWLWIWGNTDWADAPLDVLSFAPNATTYIVEGTNFFKRAPQAGDPSVYPGASTTTTIATPLDPVHPYTPLAYPHPWRGGSGGLPATPYNINLTAL